MRKKCKGVLARITISVLASLLLVYLGFVSSYPLQDIWIPTTTAHTNPLETTQRHKESSPFQEVRHVAFLKVHRCASSTVLNIMYRFGIRLNLTYLHPVPGSCIRFGESTKEHLLPPDTVYIAIVRDPLTRMQSAFNYYKGRVGDHLLIQVKGDNPFQTYLKNANLYESNWTDQSRLNNNMARDFGFQYDDFRNKTKFKKYLQILDTRFHLVMVSEQLDESLLLMHRILNWPIRDILNTKICNKTYEPLSRADVTSEVKPFLSLDQILYDHFVSKLKMMIKAEGIGFQEELVYYRNLNKRTVNFCKSWNNTDILSVAASVWHEQFNITGQDCLLMDQSDLSLLSRVQRRHTVKFQKPARNMTLTPA